MDNMPTLPQGFKPKKFWEKPEGMTGMVFLSALLIGGGVIAYRLLPYIITLLQNTLYAAGLVGALAALIYLVTNKKVQLLVSYGFKSIMRAITGWFVTIDPIGIMKSYIADLKKSLSNMEAQIMNLRGQMNALKDRIDQNERIRDESLKYAKVARDKQANSAFQLYANKAGRKEKSNLTLRQLYAKMELLYRVLMKMHETSQFLLEDTIDEVNEQETQYKMIRSGYSAFRSALKIIKGDSDAKELFDQAMQFTAEDFSQKVGEIDNFVKMSKGFIESVDIQNGVFEQDALDKLQAWEEKADSVLLKPGEKQRMIADANSEHLLVPGDDPLPRPDPVALQKRREERAAGRASKIEDLI